MFWPSYSQARAMSSLRTVISEIKSLIPKEFLCIERNSLYIYKQNLSCDFLSFKKLLEKKPSIEAMKNAVNLWKGGFLKGFYLKSMSSFNEWQIQEEQNLFIKYKDLLKKLYDNEISNGELLSALKFAQKCLGIDNFDEETHRAIIYINALRGERKFALEQYYKCCEMLKEEFNTDPEIETETLIKQIRSGELKKITPIQFLNNDYEPRFAILPFQLLNSDNQELLFFLDMVMEGLEDYFIGVAGIKMVSRTSTLAYTKITKRIPIIAAELKVDYILEGFLGSNGDAFLLEGRLIDTKSDSVLQVNSIDIESLENQNPSEIARLIGRAFIPYILTNNKNNIFSNSEVLKMTKINSITSNLKIQAKQFLRLGNKNAFIKSIELYKKTVEIDPYDAEAWAGLGKALLSSCDKEICCPTVNDSLNEAEKVAEKALIINKNEPTALNVLANIALQKEWDFERAESLYNKSLQICNNNPRVMRDYAELCILSGRYEEAMKLSNMSAELDPVNSQNFKIQFWLNLVNKEYEKANQIVRQQFILYPAPALENIMLSYNQLIQGNIDLAIDYINSVKGDLPLSWENALHGAKGYAFAKKGINDKTYESIIFMERNLSKPILPHLPIALSYTGLQEYDKAIDWIEKAVKLHDSALFFLAVNPLFAPLSSLQRLNEVLKDTHITPIKK